MTGFKYELSEAYKSLFENLYSRGWAIGIVPVEVAQLPMENKPENVYADDYTRYENHWGLFIGKIDMKLKNPICECGSNIRTYTFRMGICNEVPFEVQFEEFLEMLDNTFHEFIMPHMAGRIQDDNGHN